MSKVFKSLKNLQWQCKHEFTPWLKRKDGRLLGRWCHKCNKTEYALPSAVGEKEKIITLAEETKPSIKMRIVEP